jgi:hypothetical protein
MDSTNCIDISAALRPPQMPYRRCSLNSARTSDAESRSFAEDQLSRQVDFSLVGIRAVGVSVGFARVRIWFGDVPAGAVGAVALLARHRSVPVRVH